MGTKGSSIKTELILLGMTAIFLSGLWGLSARDRGLPPEGIGVSVQKEAAQSTFMQEVAPVDLNTAEKETLETLPGIGPELAERIVEYRAVHGGFSTAEELMEVSGIGEKTFAGLKDRITVNGGTAP